jgi:hypothetical protein
VLEGREELEGDPELLGGVDEMGVEEGTGVEILLGLGMELEPPTGRELAASICCCSLAVNVPVMPVNWNLAEKARAGYWGCVASFKLSDSNRMKYTPEFGPMVGSGVNWIELFFETSVEGEINWREVCCWEFPT